jgi:hypothetical protein
MSMHSLPAFSNHGLLLLIAVHHKSCPKVLVRVLRPSLVLQFTSWLHPGLLSEHASDYRLRSRRAGGEGIVVTVGP